MVWTLGIVDYKRPEPANLLMIVARQLQTLKSTVFVNRPICDTSDKWNTKPFLYLTHHHSCRKWRLHPNRKGHVEARAQGAAYRQGIGSGVRHVNVGCGGNVAFTQRGNDTSWLGRTQHFVDGHPLPIYIGPPHPPSPTQFLPRTSSSSSAVIRPIRCPVFSCFVPRLFPLAALNARTLGAHILYSDAVSPRADDRGSEFYIWEHSAPLHLTHRSATSRSATCTMPLS